MSLVGALVVPHPPIIVPEVGGGSVAEVQATVDAMRQLGAYTAQMAPEVIVLLSPHARLDPDRMAVCLAGRYHGTLSAFGAPEVRVDLEGDEALARSLLESASAEGVPVVGYGEGSRPVTLDHGALVPLYFLLGALERQPRLVEINFSFGDVGSHLAFGRAIRRVLDVYGDSVLYVASGDLSHRLTASAPAGYSPHGAEFDQRIVDVFADGDLEALQDIPRGVVDAAGECGYRSLLVLGGLLESSSYRTHLLSYEGPFGVGYLVARVDVVTDPPDEEAPGSGSSPSDPLVRLARETIERFVKEGVSPEPNLPAGAGPERAGVFVSLHNRDGSLRGCIGTTAPTRSTLAEEIVRNAVSAATQDPRFPPVGRDELDGLEVSVDVLGEPEPVSDLSQLDPKRYGIIVRTADGRQALLLPDLEGVDTVEDQLAIVCRKGGIDSRRDRYTLERFEVVRHHDTVG